MRISMRPTALLAMLWLVSLPSLAQGEPFHLPSRPGPTPAAPTLERDTATGNYRLSYTAGDGNAYTITVESADRAIFELGVDASVDTTYSAIGYSYSLKNTAVGGSPLWSLALPCDDPGATASSTQWRAHVGALKQISARMCWFTGPKDTRLAAGTVLSDAKITSKWLPGVGKAIVASHAAPPVWPSGEWTPRAASTLAQTVNSPLLGGRKVDVVVPLRDPALFSVTDHGTGLVLSDLSQACTLGWIDSSGICNSFEVKLKDAQAAILNNDLKLARNHLGAFQNELSAQRGKHVGELAFALLNTNVAFILFHL
jgi:hypothetical protein